MHVLCLRATCMGVATVHLNVTILLNLLAHICIVWPYYACSYTVVLSPCFISCSVAHWKAYLLVNNTLKSLGLVFVAFRTIYYYFFLKKKKKRNHPKSSNCCSWSVTIPDPTPSLAVWKASFLVCNTAILGIMPRNMATVYSRAIQCKQARYIVIWANQVKVTCTRSRAHSRNAWAEDRGGQQYTPMQTRSIRWVSLLCGK